MALQYLTAQTEPSAFGRSVRLAWEERNINVANNSSDIYWELQGYNRVSDSTGYYYAGDFTLSINGQTIFSGKYPSGTYVQLRDVETARNRYSTPNNGLIASGTTTITHDSNGSKNVRMKWDCEYIYSSNNQVHGDRYIDLSDIPRASTVSLGDTKEFGETLEISVRRASETFTHTIILTVGSFSARVENVGASTSYIIPSNWAQACPTSTTAELTVECETYNGGVQVGDTYTLTDTVFVPSDWKPTIGSFTATPLVFNDAFIQHLSTVQLSVRNVSPSTGANIVSYAFRGNDVSITKQTSAAGTSVNISELTTAGTNTWTVTVTDTRGRTAAETISATVIAYSYPTIRLTVSRCNADGTANDLGEYMTAKAVCTFSPITAGERTNRSATVYIYIDGTEIGHDLSQTTPFTFVTSPIAATSTQTYTISATLYDYFMVRLDRGVITASTRLSTAEVLMDVLPDGIAFGGSATRSKAVEIKNWALCANNHRQYPGLQLKGADQSAIGGWIWLACTLVNNLYVGRRIAFSQYSYDSSTGEQTAQFETYYFPLVDADLASQQNYEILTEKTMTPTTGTWTPTISWSDGSTLTTTSIACNWQKYGKLIHYYGYFRITDLGTTGNKNLRITLPHTVLGTANGVGTRLEAETPPAKGLLIRVASNYLNVVYSPSGGWACPQMSTGWYSFDFWALEA